MFFNMTNGSGAELAFKIVRYNSEEEMRNSTPSNNTIGVITSEKISSWIFSSEKPNSPSEGMLWIKTGNDSLLKFNALKKNAIMIYPLQVNQYNNGTWEYIIAKTYLNEWVEWISDIILFDNSLTDIEWTYKGASLKNDGAGKYWFYIDPPEGDKETDSVTSELIQLNHQEIVKITFYDFEYSASGCTLYLKVINKSGTEVLSTSVSTNSNKPVSSGTLELDISSLTPENYSIQISVRNYSNSSTGSCKISSVKIHALKSS